MKNSKNVNGLKRYSGKLEWNDNYAPLGKPILVTKVTPCSGGVEEQHSIVSGANRWSRKHEAG